MNLEEIKNEIQNSDLNSIKEIKKDIDNIVKAYTEKLFDLKINKIKSILSEFVDSHQEVPELKYDANMLKNYNGNNELSIILSPRSYFLEEPDNPFSNYSKLYFELETIIPNIKNIYNNISINLEDK